MKVCSNDGSLVIVGSIIVIFCAGIISLYMAFPESAYIRLQNLQVKKTLQLERCRDVIGWVGDMVLWKR